MKRVVFLFVILLALAFAVPAMAESGTFRNVTWTYEKGTLTISGEGVIEEEGPWSEYKKQVKNLVFCGDNLQISAWFSGYKNVKTLTLGNGVVATDDYVFQNLGAKKYTLIVQDNDYQWNTYSFVPININAVKLGEMVSNYAVDGQFVLTGERDTLLMCFGSSKNVLSVPETVEKLGARVFCRSGAKEIRLPRGLRVIEDEAFAGCSNLQQITIPGTVTTIGSGVFSGCKKLKAINFVNLTITTDYKLTPDYFMELNALKTLIIPNYTDISEMCITVCKATESIIVSEGNKKLNGYNGTLYSGMSKLKSVYLPASLEDISTKNIPYQKNTKLYVLEGTYAHQFAMDNGYPFELVKPISNVKLSEETLMLKVNQTAKLKASIEPIDASAQKVQWISTDESVATVTEGKVKAIGSGDCEIICRGLDCGGVSAICAVTVLPK